jgi:hypothetical protein
MDFLYTDVFNANSNALDTVYFDAGSQRIAIVFWSGSVVQYSNFSESDWNAFTGALSKGSFYNQRIKGSRQHASQMLDNSVQFIHREDVEQKTGQLLEAAFEPAINVTVNIYVNGDPEEIAKAVERLAPSIRAVTGRK